MPISSIPSKAQTESRPPAACKADFSTVCGECGADMRPVHSHYECPVCGWRDSCCF